MKRNFQFGGFIDHAKAKRSATNGTTAIVSDLAPIVTTLG